MVIHSIQENTTTTNRNGNYLFWRSISLVATCNCSDCRMCLHFFCWRQLECGCLAKLCFAIFERLRYCGRYWFEYADTRELSRNARIDTSDVVIPSIIDERLRTIKSKIKIFRGKTNTATQMMRWAVRSTRLIDFFIQRMVDGFMFYANSHSLNVHAITLSLLTVNKCQPA